MWQFSESSQSLLKRYAEVAEETNRNKWVKKFGHNTTELYETYNFTDIKKNIVSYSLIDSDDSADKLINNEDNIVDDTQRLANDTHFSREITEIDPVAQIDYLQEKCLKDPNNFHILANNLSFASFEKVCNHVLSSNNSNLNQSFIEKLFTILFPTYLKKETTRFSIELLIKTKSHYIFNNLLDIIIKDINISLNIIHEFSLTLMGHEKMELLKNIISFDISNETFMYHINTILLIYKASEKSEEINSYILLKLSQTVQLGSNNKNYGQLLHTYLQSQRNQPGDITILETLVDNHQSPFRKPCLNVLNQIKSRSEEEFYILHNKMIY